MADLNITAEFSDLQLLKRELIDIPKKARDSASVFEREYKRVERQIQKSAIAHQRYYKEVQQANLANKSAAQSASVFSQALAKQESRIDTLRAKYNPLYAASKQYERALEEINEANRIGALNDSQREASLEQLHKEYANGTGQFARYTAMASGRVNQMGVVTQQAGYQIGDFLVQVQSGTNAFVAFGQQATQLVGILPLMGAGFMGLSQTALVGLSAGLGIAIPLVTALGAAFMRTRDNAEDTTSKIQQIDESLREYQKTLEASARGMTLDQLFATEELTRAEAELERLKILAEEVGSGVSFRGLGESFVSMLSGLSFGLLDLTIEGKVETYEELVAAAEERLAALRERRDNEAAQRRIQHAREAETDIRNRLRLAQLELEYGEDSIAVDNERRRQARLLYLIELMREGVQGRQLANIMAQYDEYVKLNKIMQLAAMMPRPEGPEDPPTTTGGGGAVQDGVGGVARSLLTDVEKLQLEFEERRAAIEEFNAIEIELFGSKHEALERLEAEHQARMQEIKNAQEQQSLSNTSSFFGNMAKITKSGGEKTFKLYQGFAIAQALVDAYAAFNAVLKDPSFVGRPWARAAAAGAALAQGLAQVQNIRSVTSSGGGGGGGGGGAVAAPVAAAAPEPQQVIIEGIDRDSLISGEQLSKLFDRLYEENDERGIVFSVAR